MYSTAYASATAQSQFNRDPQDADEKAAPGQIAVLAERSTGAVRVLH